MKITLMFALKPPEKAKKGGNDEDLPPHPNPPHPLELQSESEQQDWGQFGDFLLQDTSSVTLEVKLSLEKEPNSAFWVSRSSLLPVPAASLSN